MTKPNLEPDAMTKGGTGDPALSQAISLKRIADYAQEALAIAEVMEDAAIANLSRAMSGRPAKQTSPEVSSLAAKYLAMSDEMLFDTITGVDSVTGRYPIQHEVELVARDLRTLAASCLSQDEVKG